MLLVKKKDSGQFFAMEILKKEKISNKKQKSHVRIERDILAQQTHPFLVRLFYAFQTDRRLYFVLEYCPGGELFNLLSKVKRLTEDHTRFYACQMVLALEFLHQRRIIYRDLKPENVLICSDGYIKIADFGLSRTNIELNEATTICGTPEYLAPEIIHKSPYGKMVDWWTLGNIIYEMLVGIPPFYTEIRSELFQKIKSTEPNYPSYLSESTRRFIQELLVKDPQHRLGCKGVQQIKDHVWFQNVNWAYIQSKRYESLYVPKIRGDLGLSNFDEEFRELPAHSFENQAAVYKKFEGFSFEAEALQRQALPSGS